MPGDPNPAPAPAPASVSAPADPTVRVRAQEAETVLAAAGVEDPRREAGRLAAFALGIPLARYYAILNDPFPADRLPAFEDAVRRRAARVPYAYIVGSVGFYGHEFSIGPGVLIPRPETELLVDAALETALRTTRDGTGVSFLDLCTGCGCVAVSLALALRAKGRTPHGAGTDLSEDALRSARENARRLAPGEDLMFLYADLFPPEAFRVDLVAANPPYIPTFDIPPLEPEVGRFEPLVALDGGLDGLDFYRRLVSGAPRFLNPGGALLLEHGADQGPAIRALLEGSPVLEGIGTLLDLAGHPRVTYATLTAEPGGSPEADPGQGSGTSAASDDSGASAASAPDAPAPGAADGR